MTQPTSSYHKQPRRLSVTPASVSFVRHGSCDTYTLPTCSKKSSSNSSDTWSFSPSDKLRKMSTLFSIERTKTREAIMAVLEDPARVDYRKLKNHNEHLMTEWKQLKKYIENLQADYEATRQLDPIRRYRQLQSMIKRTVMHVRLTGSGSAVTDVITGEAPMQGSVVQSEAKEREMEKQITQRCDYLIAIRKAIAPLTTELIILQRAKCELCINLRLDSDPVLSYLETAFTVEELNSENRRLRETNERLETRIQLIIQTVNELDLQYRSTKTDSFIRRYPYLRDVVKEVITNSDLTDAP